VAAAKGVERSDRVLSHTGSCETRMSQQGSHGVAERALGLGVFSLIPQGRGESFESPLNLVASLCFVPVVLSKVVAPKTTSMLTHLRPRSDL